MPHGTVQSNLEIEMPVNSAPATNTPNPLGTRANAPTNSSASLQAKPAGRLLRYADGAKQMSVSLNHIRNLVDAGFLTSIKVGTRGRRLRAAELDTIAEHGIDALSPTAGK